MFFYIYSNFVRIIAFLQFNTAPFVYLLQSKPKFTVFQLFTQPLTVAFANGYSLCNDGYIYFCIQILYKISFAAIASLAKYLKYFLFFQYFIAHCREIFSIATKDRPGQGKYPKKVKIFHKNRQTLNLSAKSNYFAAGYSLHKRR